LKKNIIMICIDGGRLDRTKKSPIFYNNDKSVFFSQAITYAPYTNSSIHAVISGSYGNRNGCNSYWHSIKFKKEKFKTLTEYLHDNGYYTCCDIHSDIILPKQGFDEFMIYDENNVDLSHRHNNLLQKMKVKFNKKKYFFLYLHYSSIHTGIMNSVLKVYNNFSKQYFENRDLNEKRYDELFHKAEEYLQNVLNTIYELKLDNESMILIFSDHGISVGEKIGERAYGAFCYDYTIRTFASLISTEFEKKEINQQIRHVDLMPTILDYLDIKLDHKYERIDGISLLPLINGKYVKEQIAYSETGNPLTNKAPPKQPNTKSVRLSNWKLIFNEYNGSKELYNLKKDPNEKENITNQKPEIEDLLWKEMLKLNN